MSRFIDTIVRDCPRKLMAGEQIKDGLLLATDAQNEYILFWNGEQWEAKDSLLSLLQIVDEYSLKLNKTENCFALFSTDVPEGFLLPQTIEEWRIFADQYFEQL